jgi:Domain of unknown function (DUF4440)
MRSHKYVVSTLTLTMLTLGPIIAVLSVPRDAASQPKAEWKAPKAKKAKAPAKAAPKAAAPKVEATQTVVPQAEAPPADVDTVTPPPTAAPPAETPPSTPPTSPDQSQEVLDMDLAMAANVKAEGPKIGYASTLSEVGVLYDANGASPSGAAAAESRFATFPADVTFERLPERALAAGGSGSSWGSYTIKRGDQILSAGRYISVWRRETSGWKMISELAAGKTTTPPPPSGVGGTLPKRPAQLGRATPAPVGVPLTVPTPPAATTETPSTTTQPPN